MGIRIYLARGTMSGLKFSKNLPEVAEEYAPTVPQEPEYELPTWISSGDLGTYQENEEVAITLQYYDQSNVLEDFQLTGLLPTGVVFNNVGGTISGFIEDVTTTTYNFTISMVTIYGDIITESFSMTSSITDSEIVWTTSSDLGTYDSGQSINQPIEATVEETTV